MNPATLRALEAHVASLGPALLGYSGGVDSALLAVVGARTLAPGRFLAVIGRSASYPDVQWQAARAIAARFAVPLHEVDTEELRDPNYRANPVNRCYFCKSELWRRLGDVAVERGFAAILDGTNIDDLAEHRPGWTAGTERMIRSPLAELGWSKAAVREAARALGIPIWDAPSSPCLSSRIAYGIEVTPERLRQVERGEALLRRLGVSGDLRVRHHADRARIEVRLDQLPVVEAAWSEVEQGFLALGFGTVELDRKGYRRGSLLSVLAAGG